MSRFTVDTSKNPHCVVTDSVSFRPKFEALWWWYLHKNEQFSIGTKKPNKQTKISYWIWIINKFAIPVLKRWLVHHRFGSWHTFKRLHSMNTKIMWQKSYFLKLFFNFEKLQIFDQHVSMCDTTLKSLLILSKWYCYDFVYIIHYASMEKTPFVSKTIIYF